MRSQTTSQNINVSPPSKCVHEGPFHLSILCKNNRLSIKLLSLFFGLLLPITLLAQEVDSTLDTESEAIQPASAAVDLEIDPTLDESLRELEADIETIETEQPRLDFEDPEIVPRITAEKFVPLGEELHITADSSRLISPSIYGQPSYSWDFGDETPIQWGARIDHRYRQTGKFTLKLNIRQGRKKASVTKNVVVYDRLGILVSDKTETYEGIIDVASEKGILLQKIVLGAGQAGFTKQEEFIRKIQENLKDFQEAELYIFDTQSDMGLSSFAQVWQKVSPEKKFNLKEKLWVQLVYGSMAQNAKIVQPTFQILQPDFILLTREDALSSIFRHRSDAEIINELRSRKIEHTIVDERGQPSPFLPFSWLTSYFVINGISKNVIYLLLAVPMLTFVISFFRQFVGISTFGVYAPLMLALSFLVLGLKFGFLVFCVVLVVSYAIRRIFTKIELLYIPRVSLLLSSLALSFFLVLGVAVKMETTINLTLTIFPMMVMATVSEKFISAQSEEGMKGAIILVGETVVVALLGYLFVTWDPVENAILALPEYILLPILGTIFLGKFTGLRLSEYFKFRNLLSKEDSQE